MSTAPRDEFESAFHRDVVEGLARPQKFIPCKHLYDARGSRLFEQICELEAYYPTRTELRIMNTHVDQMAEALGPRVRLVEYGAGSGQKTELLLEALEEPAGYLPVEISKSALQACKTRLETAFPNLEIAPVCADYTEPLTLPDIDGDFDRTAAYYPGSTLGNFTRPDARAFLERIADLIGPGGGALIGIDLQKEVDILERAYDDPQGVTAEFTLNLLRRINRELDADFDLDRFDHRSVWNEKKARIETHIVSKVEQPVTVAERTFAFEAGESIVVEYSYKYTRESFEKLVASAGFSPEEMWTDERNWFGVWYLTPTS